MRRQAVGRERRGIPQALALVEELERRALLSSLGAGAGAGDTPAVETAMTATTPVTYIQLDSSGANIQIYAGSSPTGTPTVIPVGSVSSISVAPSSGNDLLVVDYSNGDPVPADGISFTGAGSSLGDTLKVIGASPADPFVLGSGQVQHGTGTVTYSGVLNLAVSSGNATASSDLELLGVTVGSQASLTATVPEHIGQLTVNSGGTATVDALFGAAIVNGTLQFSPDGTDAGTSSLNNLLLAGSTDNWSGHVDLANNELVVETTAGNKAALLATLRDEVAYGMTHDAGIVSTDLPANMQLAVVDAATTGLTSFGGLPVDSNSILIAPELPGDANLDGTVDLSDLSILLDNFGTTTTAWTSGNFNQRSAVDLTDLSDVLNNFGTTTASTNGNSNSGTPVNLTDLSEVLNNFGSTATASTSGNFSGDSTVDLTDLSAVLNNFGATGNASTAVATGAGGMASTGFSGIMASMETGGTLPTTESATTTAGGLGMVSADAGDASVPKSARLPRINTHGSAWAHDVSRTVQGGETLKLISVGD